MKVRLIAIAGLRISSLLQARRPDAPPDRDRCSPRAALLRLASNSTMRAVLLIASVYLSQPALATIYYGAPFHTDDAYVATPNFATVEEAITDWWARYQVRWAYAFPGCSYTRTYPANGHLTSYFAGMPLHGTCGGGTSVRGTPQNCINNTVMDVASGTCGCPAGMVLDSTNKVCSQPGGAGINFGTPGMGPLASPSAPPAPAAPGSNGPSIEGGGGGGGPENDCRNEPVQANVGDPINVAVGNLIENEIDYAGAANLGLPLRIERTYNSLSGRRGIFGNNWSSNLDTRATLDTVGTTITVRLADGQIISFGKTGSIWVANSSVPATLVANVGGYLLTTHDRHTYQFDASGLLTSFNSSMGGSQTYLYTGTRLTSITDGAGNSLTISYDNFGLVTSIVVAGQTLQYTYNTTLNDVKFGNLTSISRPATNGAGTVSRQYLYENTQFRSALTGLIDENSNRVATWGYNAEGRATSNDRAGTENFTIDYTHIADTPDPYSLVTNAKGYQWRYHLQPSADGMVRVIGIEGLGSANCAAASDYTSYDSNGRAITVTDGNGNATLRHYTTGGLVDQLTEGYRWSSAPTGNIVDLVETATMRKQVVTAWDSTNTWPTQLMYSGKDLSGSWLQYQREDRVIDTKGRLQSKTLTDLTSLTDPYPSNLNTRTWLYTYTYHDVAQTRVQTLTVQDPRGNTVTTTFDSSGRKTQVAQPVSSSLTFTTTYGNFNAAGLPQLATDINAIPSQLTYDARNRLRQVIRNVGAPGAQTTTFDYYENGDLKRITLGDGSWLNYTYSNGVHLSRIDDNAGNYVLLTPSTLDGQWTQRRVFDNTATLRHTQNRVFDDLGRILQIVDAAGTTIKSSLAYDGGSNLESSRVGTDATTAIVRVYDALNRLKQLNTPDSNSSQYQYDAQGNIAKVTDPRGLITQYTYDGLGNLMKLQSPDSGTTKFWYDAAGNITKKLDARGVEALYTYDLLNRRIEIAYPATPAENVSFVYDYDGFSDYPKGHLSYMSDADGFVIVGAYDPFGNVLSKADLLSTVSLGSEYTYDNANHIASILYPSGRVVTYTRNSLGQITQVHLQDDASAPLQTLASNIRYKPFGPISSLSFGNGVDTTLVYDADYRVSRITATSTPNWDYTYGYDAADNINQLTDQVGNNDRLYTYDKLNRLLQDNKTIFGAAGLVEYQYDSGSNRTLWKQIIGQAQTYETTSNRQTQYGATLLLHDNAGNQTAYGSKIFSYDSVNRMSMSVVGSTTTTYRYNGLGQRTTKLATTGGNTVVTHYDYDKDGKYLGQLELNADGTYAKGDEYIWLDNMPIAQIHTEYGVNNAIVSQQLTYIHADHLNTPRAMTDSTKKIVWKWESEAYGRGAPHTNPDGDGILNRLDLRFPGQIADAETGLFYNMNRYYDPMMGRYTQSDPIGLAGGLNTYTYVNGNPMRFADPTGQHPVLIYLGIGSAGLGLYEGYEYCKSAFSKSSDAQQKAAQKEAALDAMMAGRPYNPSDIEAAKDANKEVIDSALDVINHLPPGTTVTPFDSVRDRRRN